MRFIFVFSCVIAAYSACAQTLFLERSISAPPDNRLTALRKMDTSSFIVSGYINNGMFGDKDILLINFSLTGDTIWSRVIGSAGDDIPTDITIDIDSNIYITGSTSATNSDQDAIIIKLTKSGNVIWSKKLGLPVSNESSNSICIGLDGDLIICGKSDYFGLGDDDVYIAAYNSSGLLLWCKAMGDQYSNIGRSVINWKGGYLVAASHIGASAPMALIHVDTVGNILNSIHYDFGFSSNGLGLISLSSDSLLLYGYGQPISSPVLMCIKLDSSLNVVSAKSYRTSQAGLCYSAFPVFNGQICLVGTSYSSSSYKNIALFLDQNLDTISSLSWGNSAGEFLSAGLSSDSTLLFIGNQSTLLPDYTGSLYLTTSSNNSICNPIPISMNLVNELANVTQPNYSLFSGGFDSSLSVLNSFGPGLITTCAQIANVRDPYILENVILVPNPTSNTVQIIVDQLYSELSVKFYSAIGELKHSAQFHFRNFLELDVSNLSNGIYFVTIGSNEQIINHKLIIQR
ncbi:MAG: T9SS type A sorting domain-containing protein [Bacteroidia bacterium]|nr:T9SS type A sorting domain-containing protein [Bacteroidia bacterium]